MAKILNVFKYYQKCRYLEWRLMKENKKAHSEVYSKCACLLNFENPSLLSIAKSILTISLLRPFPRSHFPNEALIQRVLCPFISFILNEAPS